MNGALEALSTAFKQQRNTLTGNIKLEEKELSDNDKLDVKSSLEVEYDRSTRNMLNLLMICVL
eukprot:snap_masked-scaffold_7-processed-gene-12.18-mRNA-1 protein AED:0.90 eAED:1.00 QI:0/-1/0/1/-1/1/1/0/62